MSKRHPQAVYDLARELHAKGMSVQAIAFRVPLTTPQIKRAVDPEYAKKKSS